MSSKQPWDQLLGRNHPQAQAQLAANGTLLLRTSEMLEMSLTWEENSWNPSTHPSLLSQRQFDVLLWCSFQLIQADAIYIFHSFQTMCKDTAVQELKLILILPKLILQVTRCQNCFKQSHRNIQVRPSNLNLPSCSQDRKRPSCISQRLVSARRRVLNVEHFKRETRGALKQAKALTSYNWHVLAW